MNDQLVNIKKKLEKRAAKLDEIIDSGKIHSTVQASVQRAASSLRLCSELLAEIREAVQARAKAEEDRLDTALKKKSELARVTEWTTNLTRWNLATEGKKLLETAQMIAEERDSEAFKALAGQAAETLVKIGMILSGAELLKLVEEFITSAMDVYQTGQSMKYRKNQVKLASDLLLWLESVSMICLTWAVQAQGLILRTEGKYEATSNDQIIEMVTKRIVALATKRTP